MTMQTDVKIDYLGDTQESTDYIASLQTPPPLNEPFILTNTEFPSETSRRLTFTTNSAQITNVFLGVIFIDQNGIERNYFAQLPTSPATVIFIPEFRYCARVVKVFILSGIPTTEISIGMTNDSVIKNIGKGNPVRLRGYSICSTLTPGEVSFFSKPDPLDPASLPTLSFKAQTGQNISLDYPIPEDGVLYKNGLYVLYNPINSQAMNVFYD